MKHTILFTAACALMAPAAHAQFSIVNVGDAYTQDFSGLPYAADGVNAWANNSTLAGWSVSAVGEANPDAIAGVYNGSSFLASANLNPAEPTYFLKAIQKDQDGNNRLGTRTGSSPGNVFATFRATNNTGGSVGSIDLSYQGSQFLAREAGAIWVSYSLDGSTWTKVDPLTYDAPFTSSGSNLALDSAQITASETLLSTTVSGLSWGEGSDLWVRWAFYRDIPGGSSGNSPVMAIDNVSFTAVPEPATFAALFGLCALGAVLVRRRNKS